MNYIDKIKKMFGIVSPSELAHYGTPRHSGRYPWGSGENPYQRSGDFLNRVEELHKQGLSETEIAKAVGLSTTQLRVQKSMAKDIRRSENIATAKKLRAEGYSLNEIAAKMGFANDSSVRALLNEKTEVKTNQTKNTADFLKKQVDEKGMIDVGKGVEYSLNISSERLNKAVEMLKKEGYEVYGGRMPQVNNPGKQTTLKVLCPPGTEHKEIYNYENIHSLENYISRDGGDSYEPKFVYPKSMDSSRLAIRYREDGGVDKDGVVEIRRGVADLSLGDSHYAQVRILVDGTHYIKGMAVYSDDIPDGTDIIFNTNKSKTVDKMDVLKPIGKDPHNPFGALIKEGINDPDDPTSSRGGQSYYIDKNGKKQLSLINKRAEEGDWSEWKDKLPSQFLSKQSYHLAKQQLDLAKKDKDDEFDEICSLTNPTVKRVLLEKFASGCDSDAVHLQAAALPRQKYQVILPLTTISEKEVYAPNYNDGEKVALVRYPHGGTFEIPILTVNNKHKEGIRVLGKNPSDAIGINSKVAERLSGADFDGDTVMVIPTNNKIKITSTPPLKGLEGFDPKLSYPYRKDMKTMSKSLTQTEMGKISNLITDMTIKGATDEELARAVRHSMVVIDAEKHKLDYKKSEADNGIAALKKRYQGQYDENGKYHEGASTIISRAKSETSVLKRRGQPWINKETGAEEWERINPKTGEFESKIVNETYVDKNGKTKVRTQKSTKMAEAKDARSLISEADAPIERIYADYANHMKSLANRARKEQLDTPRLRYSASAKTAYKTEVKSLTSKLNLALSNVPKERQAQALANAEIKAKKDANPELVNNKKELKKLGHQALVRARVKVGAQRYAINITDKEWEAIQAGAISDNVLKQILDHTDIDNLRERATPRQRTEMTPSKISRINAMKSSGYTNAEIAKALGISVSTVSKYS